MKQKIADFRVAQRFVLSTLFKSAGVFSALYLAVQLLTALVPSGIVYLTGQIVDMLTDVYAGENVSAWWIPVLALFALTVVASLSGQLIAVLSDFIRIRNDKNLNKLILDKFSKLKLHYYEDRQYLTKMDVAMYSQFAVSRSFVVWVDIVKGLVNFTSLACVIALYSPVWSLFYIMTTVPGVIVSAAQSKKMDKFSINSVPESRKKDYYYSILTGKPYAKEVRIYNLFDLFQQKYNDTWKQILSTRASIFKRVFRFELIAVIGSIVGYVVFYMVLLYKTVTGELSVGELTTMTSATVSMAVSFGAVVHSIHSYVSLFIPRILITKNFLTWEEEASGAEPMTTVQNGFDVEFRHVSFQYPGTTHTVLSDVSFHIKQGEKIALVGVNGAGKSTIVKLLLRFYEPDSGDIYLNGINIKQYSLEECRRLFGVCFQHLTTYALTLGENVALSDVSRQTDADAICQSLCQSGFDVSQDHTLSIGTPMTRLFAEDGFEPSGGQWQKIVIARALFRNAPFVILDEPSAALDPLAEDLVFRSFSKLCEDKSGILISHRLSNILMVDRILYMENGIIAESGTHTELMALQGRYAHMYHLQADKYVQTKA